MNFFTKGADLDRILILLYHRISYREDDLSKFDAEDRVYLFKEEEFARQLEYLNSQGYATIYLSQLLEYLQNKISLPKKSLIISFDDGNQSDYVLAFPLLKRYGFKATFFLTTDFIDKPDHLRKSQIEEMSKNGMEFGSHGKTHKFLSTFKEEELRSELGESKKVLEEIIGKEVNLLSLPGGYHSSKVKKTAEELGFKGICTSEFGWNENKTDSFKLKRVSLRYGDPLPYFISLVNLDKKLYFRKRLRGSILGIAKTVLGPDNYFKLWKACQRFSPKT
jgi:peptidoglycan/xylan/chitin deacetylase (PgdA/CDA1 family)